MTLVRVYLPLTADALRALHRDRELGGALPGYAVTAAVRQSDPDGDDESWEHAALQDAAAAAAEAGGAVLVAAVDVEHETVDTSESAGSRVAVAGPVRLARVAAFHVGDDVLGGPATAHDPDADLELSWYDASELEHLVSLV